MRPMSSGALGGVLQLVIIGSWMITLLWGSILAVRGAKNWSTILQVVGASSMLAGTVSFGISLVLMISAMTGSFGSASSSTPSSVAASGWAWGVVMAVGGILLLLGLILFTAGYVGMCAKYGATESRARELEGLVAQLHQRMRSGG